MIKMILKVIILLFACIYIQESYTYSFEFFKRNYAKSFSYHRVLKEHGHMHINRAEANMMRQGKYGRIANRDVVYNDRLFKNNERDAYGVSNCLRMSRGFAPIGEDGIEINLHHLHQKNDGVLIETLDTYHRKYSNELHNYKSESEINRSSFTEWKRGYWRERARMRCY